jgi:hypothetical protein
VLFHKELHYFIDIIGIIAGVLLFVAFLMLILMSSTHTELVRLILASVILLGIPGLIIYLSIKSRISKREIILDDRNIVFRVNNKNRVEIPYLCIEEVYYISRYSFHEPSGKDIVLDIFYKINLKLGCLVLSRGKGIDVSELHYIVKILITKNPNIKLKVQS